MGGASFVGRVVSNRMQKTAVVAVDYVVWRPKLKVYEKRTSKHFAHDEEQACDIGDMVRIRRSAKRSKHKNYSVEEILRKVNIYSTSLAAKEAEKAATQAQSGRAELAEAEYRRAQEKLQQLKAKFAQDIAATQLAGAGSNTSSPSQQQQSPNSQTS